MRLGEEGMFADELCAILENRPFLPRRPPLSEQDYSRLRELAFEQSASVAELVARKGRRMLEQHVLWRFRHS
jgi:hypothetical protein